jgi:hypothetical protein
MPITIYVTVSGIIIRDAVSLPKPELTNMNGKKIEMTHRYKDVDDTLTLNQECIDDAREI